MIRFINKLICYFNISLINELESKIQSKSLNLKDIDKIISKLTKIKIDSNDLNQKQQVTSILSHVRLKIAALSNSSQLKRQSYCSSLFSRTIEKKDVFQKLQKVGRKWDIKLENLSTSSMKPETKLKLKNALEKVKVIGAGLKDLKTKIMEEMYWVETFKFQVKDQKVSLYGGFLIPYFEKWKNQSSETRSFEEYMQEEINKMIPLKLEQIQKNVLVHLNQKTRSSYEVDFDSEGNILQNQKRVTDGTYIFVMGAQSNSEPPQLYMHEKQRGTFQHSSFFAGGAVKSAGMLTIENGKISLIKPYSGHYAPTNDMLKPVLEWVESKAGKSVRQHIKVQKLHPLLLKLQPILLKILFRFGLRK